MALTGILVLLSIIANIISVTVDESKCATNACACEYFIDDTLKWCESVSDGNSLKQIFAAKPKSTAYRITITNVNGLKVLPDGVLGQVSAKSIFISATSLEKVEDGAFKGSEETLESLILNHNHFTKFNFNAIRPLKKLSTFELTNDGLTEVPVDALTKQYYLTYISFASNSISTLNKNTFANLPLVVNINLRGNKLTNLGEGALATSKARKPVNFFFADNKIVTINKVAFKDYKGSILDLNDNQLTTLEQSIFEPLLDTFSKPGYKFVRGLLHVRDNPFKCDSSLKWLVEKPEWYKFQVKNFTCKDSGKYLNALKAEDLH